MDGSTVVLIATLVAFALAPAPDQAQQRQQRQGQAEPGAASRLRAIVARLERLTLRNCYAMASQYVYRRVYLPYRSPISLALGWWPCYYHDGRFRLFLSPFECDCCCLRLGGRDRDTEYHLSCTCDDDNTSYCKTCIATYLETQVMERNNTLAHCTCLHSRTCVIDDRLVRKRLSPTATRIYDRNQILAAAAAAALQDSKKKQQQQLQEKLWQCPSPDCDFVGFVSNRHSPRPPAHSWTRRLWRSLLLTTSKSPTDGDDDDPRSVRCPLCRIASCQFCGTVWTRGVASHGGQSCEAYQRQLNVGGDAAALRRWQRRARTQRCPGCRTVIEKSDGCNHMTCRCGHEWCWVCGQVWTRQHSYYCRNFRLRQDATAPGAAAQETNDRSSNNSWWAIFFG